MLDTEGEPTGILEEPVPLEGLDFVTLLIAGVDSPRHVDLEPTEDTRFADIPLDKVRGRTDTLMVIGLDRRSHTVRILHIHRDTLVNLGARGEDKITHCLAYASFYELKKCVEDLLQMPIHRFALVDFAGFQGLVDALGGVTVSVDHDLQSPTGIWLGRGTHRLDGAQALRLVRHRYGEDRGVLARMDLQHAFLVALAGEIQSGGAAEAFAAYRQSPSLLKTNLAPLEMIRLLAEWQDVDPEAIAQISLPGEPEEHYWRLDPAGTREALEEFWPAEPGPPVGEAQPSELATPPPTAASAVTAATAFGPGPFVSRSLASLAGVRGESAWALTYYPCLAAATAPRKVPILIYHTHTTESFMPELYPEPGTRMGRAADEDAFTEDLSRSVVRPGRVMAATLEEMGFEVRHITKVHDPGGQRGRTGAYGRSRVTALAARGVLGDPVVILDVHRDATTQSAAVGDGQAASILLVVARQNRWWQWNYTFARNIDSRLSAVAPGYSRGIRILDGRYNQDLSPLAIIVEVGGAESTMDECLLSARIFAGILSDYLSGP